MPRSIIRFVATILLAVQAVALLLIAFNELQSLINGQVSEGATGVALLVVTIVAALGMAALAVAVFLDKSGGRSGAIVAQIILMFFGSSLIGAGGDQVQPGILIICFGLVTLLCVFFSRSLPNSAESEESD